MQSVSTYVVAAVSTPTVPCFLYSRGSEWRHTIVQRNGKPWVRSNTCPWYWTGYV